jgi:hypothetical protein
MKTSILSIVILAALSVVSPAHESITFGPNGGKLVALDSPATPSAEVVVKEGQIVVGLFDKGGKPIALETQALTITAGERNAPKKLDVAKKANSFTAPLPAGDDFWAIFQLRETPAKKAHTFRIHYQTKPCPECKKPEWLCSCGSKTNGANITVPASLDGLFAEINQHHGELKENFAGKKYEALDEVTKAFTVLLKALPAKSADKSTAVQPQVDALVAALASIADANAGRTLPAAAKNLDAFNTGIAALKKNFPEKTANAKLK